MPCGGGCVPAGDWMTLRPLLPRAECFTRLGMIFPRAAFDTALSSPLAGAAVAAMLYVGAVVDDEASFGPGAVMAAPRTVLWMCDQAFAHGDPDDRVAWREAVNRRKRRGLNLLLAEWSISHTPWYADTSREGLRDETWPGWAGFGAARPNPSVNTTSSEPRWALTSSFADLFDPDLDGEELVAAIEAWHSTHLDPGDKIRIHIAQLRERRGHSVPVALPDGQVRELAPGTASMILKGLLEQWMPARLRTPVVLTLTLH